MTIWEYFAVWEQLYGIDTLQTCMIQEILPSPEKSNRIRSFVICAVHVSA